VAKFLSGLNTSLGNPVRRQILLVDTVPPPAYCSVKDKSHYLSFSKDIPHVNIVDGTSFTVCGKRVIQATAFLFLDDVLFVLKFSLSLLFIGKLAT